MSTATEFPIGQRVSFAWPGIGEKLSGTVEDHIRFQGQVAHCIKVDGSWSYLVWSGVKVDA